MRAFTTRVPDDRKRPAGTTFEYLVDREGATDTLLKRHVIEKSPAPGRLMEMLRPLHVNSISAMTQLDNGNLTVLKKYVVVERYRDGSTWGSLQSFFRRARN